ncbi:MAG: DUF5658 family protein [Planctomycetota bacterium]
MDYRRVPQPCVTPELVGTQQGFLAQAWTWIVEARSHRMLCLLAGLWTINLFDLVLTLIAYRQGLLCEANPVAAFLLARGPTAVCLFKGTLVALGSAILIRYRRRPSAEFSAAGLLIIYALVAVQWKWCYELYELAHTGNVSNAELAGVGAWTTDLPTP